jgi:hypothetical protein
MSVDKNENYWVMSDRKGREKNANCNRFMSCCHNLCGN